MTEQSRPKPIELVAMTLCRLDCSDDGQFLGWWSLTADKHRETAKAAFDILIKHGCISIEGIIARDEELARVAPVPERAGDE